MPIIDTLAITEEKSLSFIIDEKHHFLVPANMLAKVLDVHVDNLTTAKFRRSLLTENIHYTKHKKGDVPYFKNLKPGSTYFTRSGLIMICDMFHMPETKTIKNWAIRSTYEALTNKGTSQATQLFDSLLMDVCKIDEPLLRKKIVNQLKELKKLLNH
jgi:hypothetical protein